MTERSSRNELLYPLQLSSVYNVVVGESLKNDVNNYVELIGFC